ncbi:GNAT family N-acetyltransferase [Marininema halotolerans]|uniref:Aminoglycoside 6'-N-acetyltransferase n=1 Tax=Marininema halotolerans TaxID=1155944 RepID=A0A1I6R734_9BACL|nr:GNAT family N-acetyltransferase [Marininema halotolerans]SFS60489.1 aminoglycoside 6'-N-acetyltransferase [Marininema halotolerans]
MISNGSISIRKMTHCQNDFSLLFKWFNDKEVLSYIEGPASCYTYEEIVSKYGPRAKGKHYVTPCIVNYNDSPIGYLQFYLLQEDEIQKYGARLELPPYGLDIVIGETRYWNMGIGTGALKLILRHLFEQGIKEIFIDPQTWNIRAIRSYEKCGFRKTKILYQHERFNGEYKDNQLIKLIILIISTNYGIDRKISSIKQKIISGVLIILKLDDGGRV